MGLRNTDRRYGLVAMTLHWSMALLLVVMIVFGIRMVEVQRELAATGNFDLTVFGLNIFAAYQLHKSFGFLLFVLVLVRLGWKLVNPHPALPPGMPRHEIALAQFTHVALYALMLGIPVVGWLTASASPYEIDTVIFGLFTLPHPLAADGDLERLLSTIHFYMAMALLGVLALHVAGALKHHFVSRDDVLRRMLPVPLDRNT